MKNKRVDQQVSVPLSSWLASVDSSLYVTQVGLVSTHNSMAYKDRWVKKIERGTYLNQEGTNLLAQFNGGVRVFGLKTNAAKSRNGQFVFAHGIYDVGDDSDQAFKQLFRALAFNPSEFISFSFDPYKQSDWQANNPGVDFWDTDAAKRVHSFFFKDGRALKGTPRTWDDSVFNQWVPDLPEAGRAFLRGKPLFYIPRFGYDNPTIPKIGELRGKFVLSDESWTKDKSYSYQDLAKLDPSYAADFPQGISYDKANYRMDNWETANIAVLRSKNRDFIERLMKKPAKMPSFAGFYSSAVKNILNLWNSHKLQWFKAGYLGDNGSPSIKSLFLDGNQLSRKPPVGSMTGQFFTDFAASAVAGTTPAAIVTSLQPSLDILTGLNSRAVREGSSLSLAVWTNRPDVKTKDYLIVVEPLSSTFNSKDFVFSGGQVKSAPKLSKATRSTLSGRARVVDPGFDAKIRLNFLDNDVNKEHFSLQLLNRSSGDLYGAPRTYEVV